MIGTNSRNELQWVSKWTALSPQINYEFPEKLPTSFDMNGILTRIVGQRFCSPSYKLSQCNAVARCIIDKEPGYGAATLGCRPCIDWILSIIATRHVYRNQTHFYCFQLGFKCSLPKKRYKITIKKRADEVLPGSATYGISRFPKSSEGLPTGSK